MGNGYTKANLPSRWFSDFLSTVPSATGKTLVITGCTSGVGFITARTFLQKGGKVYGLNRPSSRSENAKTELSKIGQYSHVDCDLQDPSSIDGCTRSLLEIGDPIDVLSCNAGIMAIEDVAAPSGYDVQIQTNHFGHFQLIRGVFSLVEKSEQGRIIMHSSLAREGVKLDPKYFTKGSGGNLGGNGASMFRNGARWKRYHQTKLANVVLSKALHDRLVKKNSKVISLCCAPGLASTELQHTTHLNGGFQGYDFIWKFGQSAEDGSMPMIWCCLGEGLESGDFWEPSLYGGGKGPVKKIKKLSKSCLHVPSRDMLWQKSEEAVGKWDL